VSATCIEIDLSRIEGNARTLRERYGARGVEIAAVTKGVCGDPEVAQALVRGGIGALADSRLDNLARMRAAGVQAEYWLIRPPRPSQVERVVALADVSLNTERATLRRLAEAAQKAGRVHQVILMVESGDLREGFLPAEVARAAEDAASLPGLHLRGLGTNLVCLNGVIPTPEVMSAFSALVEEVEGRVGRRMETVSGGNSGNHGWIMSAASPGRVNHLRIGEAILLGRESTRRRAIPGLAQDAFTVVGEVIEARDKPSVPTGEVGLNALGRRPAAASVGDAMMRRAIVALGEQDVTLHGVRPRIPVEVVGICGDQLVLADRAGRLHVGDAVAFDVSYTALLRAMTSPYLAKRYLPCPPAEAPEDRMRNPLHFGAEGL